MKYILVLVQIAVLAAGYGVYFNQWIRPGWFPLFNLLALGFPVIFSVNALLILFWILYRWKIGLLFIILSLPLLFALKNIFQFNASSETTESNMKLITYNVRYFFDEPDGIIATFKKENADVILIQEMGPNPEWIIDQSTADRPYYFENFNSLGIASKYPILEAQVFRQKPYPNTFCYADIAFPTDTVRVINFYLESLHIDQKAIKQAGINSEISDHGKNIIRKVITASTVHQQQIEDIRKNVLASPHPVIVAGDMNSVPNSYEYFTISRGLKDVFRIAGTGFSTTYPGFRVPLRLDQIFVSRDFSVKNYRIIRNNDSDHYPVIAELQLP